MFMSSVPQVDQARRVLRLVRGIPASDSAGISLNRVIGTAALPDADPFLLFDELRCDDPKAYTDGFPNQPYRGFEAITYMVAGRLRHSDNKGHNGLIGPGSVQWLTAASGLMQSEMPVPQDGAFQGFQIWLNLPASEKMLPPVYRDFSARDIPAVIYDQAEIRLLAGQFHGLLGPVTSASTQPFIADVSLGPEGEISLPIPETNAGFVYVFKGGVAVEKSLINVGQAGFLDHGNRLELVAGQDGARALVVTAKPIREPIVRHGPFVMNTQAEIKQAFTDYQNGLF